MNPRTGDTFAWTVDGYNQDQGIWQDSCGASGGSCANQITFAKQWSTAKLESNTWLGAATIENGDYNLALAAVPSDQDTLLLAGGNDLWKCSLAMGCAWRNTTNAQSCMSAKVAPYQHALAWNEANPLELFVGNDSGLWRSTDAIGETGAVCASSDADHFQNLNGSLGSLADVASMSAVGASPYTMMVGLGVNGTAGVKSTTGPTENWPQILGGEGGPVAVDPANAANWYVNNGAGVSIHLCAQAPDCSPAAFGATPVVSNSDVGGDGLTMTAPATFIVDPLDPTQLLVGTCRVWRGPANGAGWTAANAVSPMLDGNRASSYCSGDALIRSMAAMALPGGGEVVYVGTYGVLNGGATLPGHVLTASMNASGVWSAWQDVTLNPVTNDTMGMNVYGFDISSLSIDPLDTTGKSIVATVAGFLQPTEVVRVIYRSTDGGGHWGFITANLPPTPANALVLDPQDSNTAYLATDLGVFSTRQLSTCGSVSSNCWSAFGNGLPGAPVVALSAAPATGSLSVLAAATYGRGVWQAPLLTAGIQPTTVSVNPTSLTFDPQMKGSASNALTVTLTNTGSIALSPTLVEASSDFIETDNCANAVIHAGASCAVQVTFVPNQVGNRTGQLTVRANVAGGELVVPLSGTGIAPGLVTLLPATINFGRVEAGATSAAFQVTAENSGDVPVPITSVSVSGPFVLASNACGTISLAANSSCQIAVRFEPATAGPATGTLTMVDGVGTQDGAAFRSRRSSSDGHALAHIVDVFRDDHRGAFGATDGRADKHGGCAADLDCGFGERALPGIDELHVATDGAIELLDHRGLSSDRGGRAGRYAHSDGPAENANGALDWDWTAAARVQREPAQPHVSSADGGHCQCTVDADGEQQRRRGNGECRISDCGSVGRQLLRGLDDVRDEPGQRKQLQRAGDLYAHGVGAWRSQPYCVHLDPWCCSGHGAVKRYRQDAGGAECQSGATYLCRAGAGEDQRGADSDDFKHRQHECERVCTRCDGAFQPYAERLRDEPRSGSKLHRGAGIHADVKRGVDGRIDGEFDDGDDTRHGCAEWDRWIDGCGVAATFARKFSDHGRWDDEQPGECDCDQPEQHGRAGQPDPGGVCWFRNGEQYVRRVAGTGGELHRGN